MPSKVDLLGRRFGTLVVLSEDGKDAHGAYLWRCACDCGETVEVRGSSLTQGVTQSCGCGVRLAASLPRSHGMTRTPLYQRWRAMLARTQNSNNPEYKNYGGRGIAVCKRWFDFTSFAADMGADFSPELELERDDVNGNYEPCNCRWATRKEQARNQRRNHRLTWRGRTMTVVEWAEALQLKPNTIITRVRRGWSPERALSEGVAPQVLLEIANG